MTRRKEARQERRNTDVERMWNAEERKQASIVYQLRSICCVD